MLTYFATLLIQRRVTDKQDAFIKISGVLIMRFIYHFSSLRQKETPRRVEQSIKSRERHTIQCDYYTIIQNGRRRKHTHTHKKKLTKLT